ncbi:MAG: DUF1559 domain-containing protein [Isosphaeraceae bacterium]
MTLLCPSESMKKRPFEPYGTTNYMGNYGGPGSMLRYSGTIIPTGFDSHRNGGPVGFESITDGTSTTAMLSERLVGIIGSPAVTTSSNDAKRAAFLGTQSATADSGNSAQTLSFVMSCKNLPNTTTSTRSNGGGYTWCPAYPLHLMVSSYNHVGSPNSINCLNPADASWLSFVSTSGSAPPSSNHSGGVNIAFADGSVHFIKDTVGMMPWWSIGTRNGGEVVGSDQY